MRETSAEARPSQGGSKTTAERFQKGEIRPPTRNLSAIVLMLVAGVAAYGATFGGGLQIDDFNWFAMARDQGIMGNDHTGIHFWRPFISIVFWWLWKIFGINPTAFRLFAVALSVTAGYAVRGIWLRVCPEPRVANWSGLLLGLLFVLWPTHVETVAWIAGVTDGLSVSLGALALWSYLVYRQDGKVSCLLLSIALLVASLTSKEAALPFPLLCFGFCAVLVPWKRTERWTALLNALVFISLTVGYIVVRGHVIGRVVGGYSNTTRDFIASFLGDRLPINLSHAYIPFDRYWATWQGPDSISGSMHWLLFGAVMLVAWLWPGAQPMKGSRKQMLYGLLVLWLVTWAVTALPYSIQYGYFLVLALASSLGWRFSLVVLLVAFLAWPAFGRGRGRRLVALGKDWIHRSKLWLDPEQRPWALPLLLGFLTYRVHLDGGLKWWPTLMPWLFGVAWVLFAVRPIRPVNDLRAKYLTIGLTSFGCSVIALLPALAAALPTGFEDMLRWSYIATVFSGMAIVSFVLAVVEELKWRMRLVSLVLVAATVQLVPGVAAYHQAGLVSNETAVLIKSLLPARRIYVLAAPAEIAGAGLFIIGLPNIAADIDGDKNVQIVPLFLPLGFHVGDRIDAQAISQTRYRVFIEQNRNVVHLAPFVITYGPQQASMFDLGKIGIDPKKDSAPLPDVRFVNNLSVRLLSKGGVVTIKDFVPGRDHVIVVNAHGAIRLDP